MTQYEKLIAEMTVEKLAELRITDTENSNGFWTGDFDGYSSDWDEALGMEVDWLNEEVEDEVKPCPSCRCEASIEESVSFQIPLYFVACKDCGIRTGYFSETQKSIEVWNRRV